MSPRLAFALDAAYRAGRSTLAHFGKGEFETKRDATPVTDADLAAERLIRELIHEEYPGESILGEEEGGDRDDRQWVIDPIDGTKSFVCGVPLYATLLSFEEEGQPTVAVCYFPALDQMLYAERDGGAFFNGRPCRVSAKTSIEKSTFCCGGHRTMIKYGRDAGVHRLAERAMATRTWSDAYGHALVATGRVEGMIDPHVRRWDVSPMHLIVCEAGGRSTTFSGGNPLEPVAEGDHEFVTSNGLLHAAMLDCFR
jgi:histidinol-phosphatase